MNCHYVSGSPARATSARGAIVRRSLVLMLFAASLLLGTTRRPTPLAAAPPTGLAAADWEAIQAMLPPIQQDYLKASNTGAEDHFGERVAISGDTVVVGAPYEDSGATGVGGNQADNSAIDSGAAYVFIRSGATWTQQAYLKASNTGADDRFGSSVAISGDMIVVGAQREDSAASGVGGNQADNSAPNAGATYVFTRTGQTQGVPLWTQQAYLKASNTGAEDWFGASVAISGDTIVVGAQREDSAASGVGGDPSNNSVQEAGAAYVFARSGATWTQQAYLKASNTGTLDHFGSSVAVDGNTVVVGAPDEDSAASGVNGNPADNSASQSGAAYVFTRSGVTWTHQAYLKASNTEAGDEFGASMAVDGNTVVVGAQYEDSAATGVNGNQADNSVFRAGAAYGFTRSGGTWTQQAYLKASNPETIDLFGSSVAVDGNTIVIGADREDSGATGVNGNQADNSADDSGAAYGFTRSGATWTPQAYLKATNAGAGDFFGSSVAVDGDTVVVGAPYEDSAATGVGADQTDNSAVSAGAIYSFSAGNLPTATPTIIVTPSVPTTTATTPATATASATPTVIVTPTTPTGAVSRIYLPLITVVAGP